MEITRHDPPSLRPPPLRFVTDTFEQGNYLLAKYSVANVSILLSDVLFKKNMYLKVLFILHEGDGVAQ